MKDDKRRLNIALSLTIILLSAAGFAAWMLNVGNICDDLYFYRIYPAAGEGEPGPWRPAIETIGDGLRSYVNFSLYGLNPRLAHILAFPAFALNQAVVDLLHGLMFGVMLAGLGAAVDRRWFEKPTLTAVVVALVWITWPWSNMKASSDYMFNYLWPTAMNVWFIVLLLWKIDRAGRAGMVATCALGAVAAAMNEGIAVSIDAAIVAWIVWRQVCCRKGVSTTPPPSRRQMVAGACYIVGSMWLMMFPSIYNRVSNEPMRELTMITLLYQYVIRAPWVYIALGAVPATAWRLGARGAWKFVDTNIFFYAAMTASYVVALYINSPMSPRIMWVAFMMSTLIIARCLTALAPGAMSRRWPAVVAAVVLTAFYAELSATQARLYAEYRAVDRQYKERPGEHLLYVDLSTPDTENWAVQDVATGYYHPDDWVARGVMMDNGMGQTADSLPVILPVAMQGRRLESLPEVAGTAGLRMAYPWLYSENKIELGRPVIIQWEPMEGLAATVEYQPRAFGRLVWKPRAEMGRVTSTMLLRPKGIAVTRRLIEEGATTKAPGDTLWFYSLPTSQVTMRGMRPVRIDFND